MIRKVFKQMTFVQILSSAMVSVCLLVDSIVIARLIGVDAVSAYGLANPLLIFIHFTRHDDVGRRTGGDRRDLRQREM